MLAEENFLNQYKELTVLVATKDRFSELTQLLLSLEKSSKRPGSVIVVHSGYDVSNDLRKFSSKLNITTIRSEISSQIHQKKLGLQSLPVACKWVLFLDDDILLEPNSIELLFQKYVLNYEYRNYSGFGLAIRNRVIRRRNSKQKFLLYLLNLFSYQPGVITKSGHPQSYLDQIAPCSVEWLNGISLWKKEVLHFYYDVPDFAGYSAYEDVMFSYKVSRSSELIFAADCFVLDQVNTVVGQLTVKQFVSASFARFIFVNSTPGMSLFWLAFNQIFRSIDFIFMAKGKNSIFKRASISFKILQQIYLSILRNTVPLSILEIKD